MKILKDFKLLAHVSHLMYLVNVYNVCVKVKLVEQRSIQKMM